MNEAWQEVLAAWRLAEAGRWDEAMDIARGCGDMSAVLAQRARQPGPDVYPVLAGWRAYYKAEYQSALGAFLDQLRTSEEGAWLTAWATLGVAKIASDCGRWRSALNWCACAWRCAAKGEHVDLLSQIAGARGEILLRAGAASESAAAFAEDLALLPPGSRYRGRVRCYQAHAYARLGPHGENAAQLAYRLAIHSPGEAGTASFATAGLALLAARMRDPAILEETRGRQLQGLAQFWSAVAGARLANDDGDRRHHIAEAAASVSPFYFAERWWLSGWADALGIRVFDTPALRQTLGFALPTAPMRPMTRVEDPVTADEIEDAPWWGNSPILKDPEAWWGIRDSFMP
jgi:hypothetical protein